MKTFNTAVAFASFLTMGVVSSTSLRGEAGQEEAVIKPEHHRILEPVTTPEEVAFELTYQLAKQVPVVGGLASAVVSIFWDTSDDSWWGDLLDAVQSMIDAAVFELEVNDIKTGIDTIEYMLGKSLDLDWDGDGSDEKLELLKEANNEAYKVYKMLHLAVTKEDGMDTWDLTTDSEQWAYNYLTVEYAVIFAPLHLSILKDIYLYGEYYHPEVDGIGFGEVEKTLYKDELEKYAYTYQYYFDWMRDNFEDERIKHIDYGNKANDCYSGSWWVKDEIKEFDNENHYNSCRKSKFTCSDAVAAIQKCTHRKMDEALFDEIMPELKDAFFDVTSPMATIEADATNYPELSCNPDQIHQRDSVDDDWVCVDRDLCLYDDVDGSCENDATCSHDDDCTGKCTVETGHCISCDSDDQILARRSTTDNWGCVDKDECLTDGVEGSCGYRETCSQQSDCGGGLLLCDEDIGYCCPFSAMGDFC